MSAIEDIKIEPVFKKDLEVIPDASSSKMSLWAKASSVLNPTKLLSSDKKKEEVAEIVEISESKLGASTPGQSEKDDKSLANSQITNSKNKSSKLNQ